MEAKWRWRVLLLLCVGLVLIDIFGPDVFRNTMASLCTGALPFAIGLWFERRDLLRAERARSGSAQKA